MRLSKVTKLMAAAVVGTMLMLPMTASAWTFDHGATTPHQVTLAEQAAVTFTVEDHMSENYGGSDDDEEYYDYTYVGTARVEQNVVARWTNAMTENKSIVVEYSEDPSFPDNAKTSWTVFDSSDRYYDEKNAMNFSDYLTPGTYYVRTFVREEVPSTYDYVYGPSTQQTINVPAPKMSVAEQKVTDTSVYFRFSAQSTVDGYEIYRKVGSKYQKIAKISDNVYTDKGLTKGKTYSYKMRTYADGIYGDWCYCKVTTWGNALKLRATAITKKNSIKLTWQKVPGASGYEIYRYDSATTGVPTTNYIVSDNFANYKLVKTIKKAKTKTYTDKKLDAGNDYSYMVVAYKNAANGKTKEIMVQDTTYATLDFAFTTESSVNNADGSVTLNWQRTVGADGYKIDRQISTTDAEGYTKWVWSPVATLPVGQLSYTFPAYAENDASYGHYRIYAYQGTKNSDAYVLGTGKSTASEIPSVSTVSAVPTPDGLGVQVSWTPVPGATSYRVYRSTSLSGYNARTGEYNGGGTPIYVTTTYTDEDDDEGTPVVNTYTDSTAAIPATQTSVTDIYSTYKYSATSTTDYLLNKGPELGRTYYYYVQAYRAGTETVASSDSNSTAYAKVTLGTKVSVKAPKLSSAKSTKKGQVKLTWKNVKGAQTYYVYCSTKKKAKNYMCVGSTTKKNYTVQGLDSNKIYYFKVVAAVGNEALADTNVSKASNVKSVKVK